MKKPNTSIEGKNVKVGELLVNRLIPADHISSVGPFLLLDHGYPVIYKKGAQHPMALNEHPHRGLVAFTYVMDGEVEHFDSLGNHAIAGEGCAHWLSAGKGVLHAERVSLHLSSSGGTLHAIQFWTDIPAVYKGDEPKYRSLDAVEFPVAEMPDNAGSIRILLGTCGTFESPLESLSRAFLYRATLQAKSEFRIHICEGMESAVFVPDDMVIVNGDPVGKSQLLFLTDETSEIVLRNPGIRQADAFILGGPEPAEPVVVQGPFAMNSAKEITDAYRDFFAGAYGTIAKRPGHDGMLRS